MRTIRNTSYLVKKLNGKVKTLLIIISVLLFNNTSSAQNDNITISEIDSLIQNQINEVSPGCVIGVIKDGVFIHKKAYGLANLDYDIPLTTASVFRIASTSKQFTAASVFLLEEQGEIKLNDDISKYLDDLPVFWDSIRVKDLLYHTSGLRDYTSLMYLLGAEDDYHYTEKDLYQLTIRQRELDFKPGTQFSYSNTGYFLLAKIIESISGVTLNEFAKTNLFTPLVMTNTHFHDNHKMIVKNRAYGYSFGKNTYEISMSNNDIVGDGGIFTTIDDLKLWDDNFYTHKVGGLDWYNKMITPGKLNNNDSIPYAGGLFIRNYRGLKKINHSGWYAGFKSCIAQYPEAKTSIIILSNSPDITPPILVNQIADIVLKDKLEPKISSHKKKQSHNKRTKTKQHFPKDLMHLLIGKYFSPELNFNYEIFIENEKLYCRIGNNKLEQIQFVDKDSLMIDEYITVTPRWEEKYSMLSAFTLSIGDIKNIFFYRIDSKR